ncbi:MAG: PAS domain-containing sensor histidine kinase [Pseudomonadota bacterium]|nr:PAS domain-containing sensor histidine kinase [Pseudomonadota bacterium]
MFSSPAGTVQPVTPQWKALVVFNLYRIGIAGLLLLLYLNEKPQFLGSYLPDLYTYASVAYIALTALSFIAGYQRSPPFPLQVYVMALADIAAITVLMYSSGGATTGLGMLMIVAVAGASMLMPGRHALFFAAIASITVLLEEFYAYIGHRFETTAYSQAGILGVALFVTAWLAMTLARRLQQTEMLALQQGIDLEDLAELNRHIIDRMSQGVIVVDEKGNIRQVNQTAWHLLGRPVVGHNRPLQDVSYPLNRYLTRIRERPEEAQPDMSVIQGLRVRAAHINPGSAQRGCVLYLEDAAEINRHVQETKLASLGQLTASIAHEIRNPLGAIGHAAQLLQESEHLDADDLRLTGIVNDQTRRMNAIIRNILQLSRRDPPRQEGIALIPWLIEFSGEFSRVRKLPVESINVSSARDAIGVVFDPGHLHQIMWNLCVNAFKYGRDDDEEARIDIRVGDARDTGAPYVDVIDHGPGIPPGDQARLFEPFYTTSTSGTGLGLYVSRQLCEKNGGAMTYIPSPSGGSCFRVQFSRQPA